MSTPVPDVALMMLKDLLKQVNEGRYKYFIGDICEVNQNEWCFEKVKIKFPYCYDVEGKPTYIVNETPIPLAEDELKSVAKNKDGLFITVCYLEDLIEEYKRKANH